jgi:hypothetical protein
MDGALRHAARFRPGLLRALMTGPKAQAPPIKAAGASSFLPKAFVAVSRLSKSDARFLRGILAKFSFTPRALGLPRRVGGMARPFARGRIIVNAGFMREAGTSVNGRRSRRGGHATRKVARVFHF